MYKCMGGWVGVCMTGVCIYETGDAVDVDDFAVIVGMIGIDASTRLYMAVDW